MRLGRREDEDDMGWRLFESLQERIEGGRGQHVNFVDNVDLPGSGRRHELRAFANFADGVDTVIRSAVDFDDVDGVPGGDLVAA